MLTGPYRASPEHIGSTAEPWYLIERMQECRMSKPIEVIGKRFARLTILELLGYKQVGTRSRRVFRCRCDCGNELQLIYGAFASGGTKSCGCLKRDKATTHGQSKNRIYFVWRAMHDRCAKPNNGNYKNYGARGIRVCKRWADYLTFVADMGERPVGASIERANVNGNYEPSNCHWATQRQQMNNLRRNVRVTFKGVTKTMAQWARDLGLPRYRLDARIKAGWSVAEAFTKGPSRGERRDLRKAP